MTRDKNFKRIVRGRAQATGTRYMQARSELLRDGPQGQKEGTMIPVTVQVRAEILSEEKRAELESGSVGDANPTARMMRREEEETGMRPVLVLTEVGGDRVLPIWCGSVEATSVAMALKGQKMPRPMTHDLLNDVVASLGEVREVRITRLEDTTYFAELSVIDRLNAEKLVPCRPSDGIALAVRAQVPILVNESLFQAHGLTAEDVEVKTQEAP